MRLGISWRRFGGPAKYLANLVDGSIVDVDLNDPDCLKCADLYRAFEAALKAVANPNALLVNSNNPLACQAAKLGRRGLLAAALRADAWGVTAADAGLRTPLHYAALAGDLEAVRLVFDLKPERVRPEMLIKQQDTSKMTVLHAAVLSGNEAVVLLLLEAGSCAAIDVQGTMGLFPVQDIK